MIVQHERKHLPAFVLIYLSLCLPLANLFVEGVKKLLTRRGAGKGSSMMQRPAKSPKVEQAFLCPGKWHTHAIKKIDDLRSHVAHPFDRRLVGKKVAAINGIVDM